MSARVAELQVVLEGVPLPAARHELVDYARGAGADASLLVLLERLPEREYRSIDEVGEALQPVQPTPSSAQPPEPKPESGLPPGGEVYTDPSAEPGAVHDG